MLLLLLSRWNGRLVGCRWDEHGRSVKRGATEMAFFFYGGRGTNDFHCFSSVGFKAIEAIYFGVVDFGCGMKGSRGLGLSSRRQLSQRGVNSSHVACIDMLYGPLTYAKHQSFYFNFHP